MKAKRCRHEWNSWILGGAWEWCFRCGALRGLAGVAGSANHLRAATQWLRPTGPDGKNPEFKKLTRDSAAMG